MSKHINQLTIKIDTTTKYFDRKELRQACLNLSSSAFILYTYFLYKADQSEFYFSVIDFLNFSNLSLSTEKRAFKELVEKKFLIRDFQKEGYYIFYSAPVE